ncbi:hypothetical protein ABPG72_008977 [Tetrahymena utriculariae]
MNVIYQQQLFIILYERKNIFYQSQKNNSFKKKQKLSKILFQQRNLNERATYLTRNQLKGPIQKSFATHTKIFIKLIQHLQESYLNKNILGIRANVIINRSIQFKHANVNFNFNQAIQEIYKGIIGIIYHQNKRIFFFKNAVNVEIIKQFHTPLDIEEIQILFHSKDLKIIVLYFDKADQNFQ